MLQVIDTHRLPYKNAVLRAWSNNTKTIAIDFYECSDPSGAGGSAVGPIIRTNEQGYIFNADGTQPIHSLLLDQSAIIEVSLDNGVSWPIQWTVFDIVTTAISAALSSLKKLRYHTKDGTDVFEPTSADKELPEYAFKTDFVQGEWGEEEIYVDDNTSFAITKWTHYIQLVTGVTNVTITGSLRAGQYIMFRAGVNCTVTFHGTSVNMVAGHVYLLWAINTFTDITYVSDAHIVTIATGIAATLVSQAHPDTLVYAFRQNDYNYQPDQTCVPYAWNVDGAMPKPDSDAIVLVFESISTASNDITLKIPNPTFRGNHTITVLMSRTDTTYAGKVYLQIGEATRVWIGQFGVGNAQFDRLCNLVVYKSIGGVLYNIIAAWTNAIDNQAQT